MTSDHELRTDAPDLDSFARDLLGRSHEAEDVAQDLWVAYGGEVPRRVRNVPGWLRIVVLRMASLARQREHQRARRERIAARPDRTPSVLEQLERESQGEFLAALVAELDEPYRAVVRLRYLEDFEIEDIAVRVRRSPGTVRSQLKRGLDRLRQRLGADPDRRRRLVALFPLIAPRAARTAPPRVEAFAPRPALLWGTTACLCVLGFWVAGARGEREVAVAAAERSEEPRGVPPEAPSVDRAARTALVPEAARPATVPEPAGSRGIDVEGDVLAPDGTPVAGAAILVGNEDGSETEVAARSDAAGHYRLEGAARRRLIRAEAPGQAPSARHLLGSVASAGRLDLRLGDALTPLSGHVLTSLGRPVARAEVVTIPVTTSFYPTDEGTLALVPPLARAVTAADGSFQLEVPRQAQFHLFATAEGHPPRFLTAPETDGAIEITLPVPGLLEGSVVRADGTPAAGARLGLVFPFLPARETTTDDSGRYCFEALPPGPHLLRLLDVRDAAAPSCFLEGHLKAGERAVRRIELRDEHTVRGRALAGDAPLAGWDVELEDLDLTRYPRELRRTRTDADGSFAFPSCSLEDRHVLRLYEPANDSESPIAVASEVRAGKDEVLLRSDPASARHGCLAGRFESRSARLRPVLATLRSEAFSVPPLLAVEPTTGAFEMPALPAGKHSLRAWVPEIGVWDAGTLEIRPGEETELTVAVPEPGFLRVELDPGSGDRDGLVATISTPTFQDSEAVAYPRGLREAAGEGALVAELFPGEYEYQVSYRGRPYETRRVRVEPGRTTVDTLHLRDVVAVRLHLSLERPLRGGEVISLVILEADGERSLELTEQPGSWEWRALTVGLARDTREVRVVTDQGLAGRLLVDPADIVPGRILKVSLEESADR